MMWVNKIANRNYSYDIAWCIDIIIFNEEADDCTNIIYIMFAYIMFVYIMYYNGDYLNITLIIIAT